MGSFPFQASLSQLQRKIASLIQVADPEMEQNLTSIQSKVWLVHTKRTVSMLSRLSMNVIREVCEYLSSYPLLASIHESSLHLHDLEKRSVLSFSLSEQFQAGTVFCFYRERTLLCVGGAGPSGFVWSLDATTGGLAREEDLHERREWCGVLRVKNAVYAFGGNIHPSLSSCEEMNVSTRKWRKLPNMLSPKVAFTPCEHNEEVYLACPMPEAMNFEVFNPAQESFRALPIFLSSGYYGSVTFFAANTFIMVTYGRQLISWKLDTFESTEGRVEMTDTNSAISNVPSVCYQQQVWWVNYVSGNVVQFDIASSRIQETEFEVTKE